MNKGEISLSVGMEFLYLDECRKQEVLEQCKMNDCTQVLFSGLVDAQSR